MMLRLRIPFVMAALALAMAATLPAQAATQKRSYAARTQTDQGNAAVERLNEESLQRARQGTNAPGPGADTTSNLNRQSERAAEQGRNMNQAPMPFR